MPNPREPNLEPLDHLRRDLLKVALADRWDRLFTALAWLHLIVSAVGQWLYLQPWHRSGHHVALWCGETVLVLVFLRRFAGRLWYTRTPLAGVLMRVWASFLLVAFGAATLNKQTGFTLDWFKLSWASLSTFGWATTAALLGWPFLIPAFQMYFSGLLMTRYPEWSYLIFGGSWFLSLQTLAAWIAWRRRSAVTRSPRRATPSEARASHHLRVW